MPQTSNLEPSKERRRTMKQMMWVALFVILLVGSISVADAQTVNIIIGSQNQIVHRFFQTSVLKWRLLVIVNEGGYTTLQYFTASSIDGPKYQFLGSEIFDAGRKIRDTYPEND